MIIPAQEYESLIAENEQKTQEILAAEITELEREQAELNALASKDAATGDIDGYLQKLRELSQIGKSIFVKKACLDKLSGGR